MTIVCVWRWMFVGFIVCSVVANVEGDENRPIRLFILSGQSNMARLDSDASFTPTVKKAFMGDEVIVVKSAQGGQPIRRWYVNPKLENTSPKMKGDCDLYIDLMAKVNAATKDKKIDSIAFVWMQGESDAQKGMSAAYEANLRGLIKQLRDDLKRPDLVVVIGRLSDYQKGTPSWDEVRAAQVKVAQDDPHAAWVDTDDINGSKKSLHHTQAGYRTLGKRFADKAIELLAAKP